MIYALLLFAAPIIWMNIGGIILWLVRIKSPPDTPAGKAEPISAWISLALMLICWPFVFMRRDRFARVGDDDNPHWLVDAPE
jgi:hypothetical protein